MLIYTSLTKSRYSSSLLNSHNHTEPRKTQTLRRTEELLQVDLRKEGQQPRRESLFSWVNEVLTYLPEIFHPGSSSSSFSPTPDGIPTTTSDLMVRSEATRGAPGSEARGPMAAENGVSRGA
jgi:hypothetical protein